MTPNPRANHCFGFEQDFVGNWRCIPLCVRRKLDLIGLKLKLNHWLAMSQAQRQDLVDWDDQPTALAGMAEHCRNLTRSMVDGEAKPLPPARGSALGGEQWQQLNELERFALCKLARPGHDHHNLEAAFSELLG